ncbi:hypothetical protein MFLAVUS_000069 [Mucor flavus]|uniref:Uncharacterized protein n=1 Tax=Mucor flavus TaxID=439312 RepID=A0ABP9YIN3_9FUNG
MIPSITREEGCSQLINIGMKLQGTQNIIVRFMRKMLKSFPLDDLGEVIKEDDLKSRYILPILQSLFDNLDDENIVFFKITNENNAECKQKTLNVSHRRPDGQFRQKAEHKNLITIGYMEAKPESESKNYDACMQDLFRLATFGKNAIDFYYLKSTLLIQAIGPTFTFYLLQKKSEDVYSMVELDKINFPMNINEVPGIFGYLDRISIIVDIFKKYVRNQNSDISDSETIRKTMRSPTIRSLTDTWIELHGIEGVDLEVKKDGPTNYGQVLSTASKYFIYMIRATFPDMKMPVIKHIVYEHVLDAVFSSAPQNTMAGDIAFSISKEIQDKIRTFLNPIMLEIKNRLPSFPVTRETLSKAPFGIMPALRYVLIKYGSLIEENPQPQPATQP